MRFEKRIVIRQLTTKLLTKILGNLSTEDISREERIEIMQDLLKQLNEKVNELKSLHSQIQLTVASVDLENEFFQSQEYQEKIVVGKGRVQNF